MNYLFYFGHPAQYLFLRETIKRLSDSNKHVITILIKTKDVLEDLIKSDGFDYTNILPVERGKTKASIILSLLKRLKIMYRIIKKIKPDLMIGTDASIAQLGFIMHINSVTITEDDYQVIKSLARLSYPFTNVILCPRVCDVGKWENKKVGYNGYMKLGYLHPNIFKPDDSVIRKYNIANKFVLIRLARLRAHHDFNNSGIDSSLLDELLSTISENGLKVYISSESKVENKYSDYLLKIAPQDMHQVLAQAQLLISDSQSMSVEAAMLGVPSIRYSNFTGKISVLEELEQKYELSFGVQSSDKHAIISRLKNLLSKTVLKTEFQERQKRMLGDKIDVSAFLVWFLENYPESLREMKINPGYQQRFMI